jgi:flagellar motor switch protein FliN
MTSTPNWIQPIEHQLKEMLNLPDISFFNSFPIDDFTSFISSQLGISPLSIEIGSKDWKTGESFFSGLGSSPISISFQASPLSGEAFWIMPLEDLQILVSWIKDRNQNALELNDPELIKGMYRYSLLVALDALTKTEAFKDFSFKFSKDSKLEEKGYAIDVSLLHNEKRIWGRLILSHTFKASFMNYFSKERLSIEEISKQFPSLKIPLSISNGSIELTKEELLTLEEGDFIVIDNAFFRPSDEKGSLKVLLNNTPLFQIKLKEGKLKILDFIYSYEETPIHAE